MKIRLAQSLIGLGVIFPALAWAMAVDRNTEWSGPYAPAIELVIAVTTGIGFGTVLAGGLHWCFLGAIWPPYAPRWQWLARG